MSKYIEFPLDGGGTILIETADEPARSQSGFLRGGEAAEPANQARGSFDESVEAVRRSADLLVSKLRTLSTPPDELEVNFSLKASSEQGSLAVGRHGADANFVVSLKWRKGGEQEKDREKGKATQSEAQTQDPLAPYDQMKRRQLPEELPGIEELDGDEE